MILTIYKSLDKNINFLGWQSKKNLLYYIQ
jgi:hypothetical protein